MNKLLIFFSMLFCNFTIAQTFNGPESVEYDTLNSRWLVGQNGSGQVLEYHPASASLTPFCSGMTSGPYGIEILGNVLYCCDGSFIKGYDLTSGLQVFTLNLNAAFLNGITSDGSTYLFATDFSGKKIYRVNVQNATFNLMTTTVKTPNGIIYDGANNRCVFVTWNSGASFQAMSLVDSTISTLKATTYSSFDGIMRDLQGNWYASSWGNSSLIKFDSTFTVTPAIVKTGLSSPADLGINANGDSIGIPNSGTANNVVFYAIPSGTTGLDDLTSDKSGIIYPNPSNYSIAIILEEVVINGSLSLYDQSGRLLISKNVTGYRFNLERGSLPSGNYSMIVANREGKNLLKKQVIFE